MNKNTIQKMINSGHECCMAITGGGMGAIGKLTKYGGASKFLVSAHVPYSKFAYKQFTGISRQDDFVSLEACKELTRTAYYNTINDSGEYLGKIGVGCTAKLRYEGERQERIHKAFIGIYFGSHRYSYYEICMENPWTDRSGQENELSEIILSLLANTIGSKISINHVINYKTTVNKIEGT